MVLIFNLIFSIEVGKRKKKILNYDRVVTKSNVKLIAKYGRPRFILSDKYKYWEEEMQKQAKKQLPENYIPTEKDLKVEIQFQLKDRRSPDLTNLPKSICDAMNKIVWKDDRQISEIYLSRKFGYKNPKIVLFWEEI